MSAALVHSPEQEPIETLDASIASFLDASSSDEAMFNYPAMGELVDAGLNVHDQLRAARSDLKSLKEQWLRAEVKSRYLQELRKDSILDVCTEEQLLAMEANRAAATELREKKREVSERVAAIRIYVSKLAEEHRRFVADREQFVADVGGRRQQAERLAEAAARAREQNMSSMRMGSSDDDLLSLDTYEKCQHVLDNQLEAIERLVEDTEAVQAEVSELESQARPLADEVDALRERVAAAAQAGNSGGDGADPEPQQRPRQSMLLDRKLEWYNGVNAFVAGVTGCDIRFGVDDAAAVDFVVGDHTITASFNEAGTRFHHVSVAPSSFPCSDIFAYAIETQDLQFLVRETSARAAYATRRANDIEAAVSGHPRSRWAPDATDVRVTLEVGVDCALFVSFDYPAPQSQVVVRSLEGACGWVQDDLDRIRRDINAERVEGLGTLLKRLEESLREQARIYEEA